MPKFGDIIKLARYAPTVIGVIQQLRGGNQAPKLDEELTDVRDSVTDMRKQIANRFEALEQENVRLKTRIREVESSFTMLRVLLYPIGVFALLALILALVALLR